MNDTIHPIIEILALGALVVTIAAIVIGVAMPCLPCLAAGCVALATLALAFSS